MQLKHAIVIFAIMFLGMTSFASTQCLDLFKTGAQALGVELKIVNAENNLKVFSEMADNLMNNPEHWSYSRDSKISEAAKAVIKASFAGRRGSYIHRGLLEKRADRMLKKLDLLFKLDPYYVPPKELESLLYKARLSLAVVGIRRFVELEGYRIAEHWDFSSLAASRMTLWHDIIKPMARIFILSHPFPYKTFTPEEAMNILYQGVYSPASLIWNNQYKQNQFLKIWEWWSSHSFRTIGAILVWGSVTAVVFGSGMVYKATLNYHSESIIRAVSQSLALKSMQEAIIVDTPNSILQSTIEMYKQENYGKEPPPEYVQEVKRKILISWPNAKFSD